MSEAYHPSKTNPHPLVPGLLSGLAALAAFALLPLLHIIELAHDGNAGPLMDTIPDENPIFLEPEEKPIVVEEKKLQVQDLKEPLVEITPEMIESMLDPRDGGAQLATGWHASTTSAIQEIADIIEYADLEKKPSVLVAVEPQYPYGYKNTQARVTVEFIIEADGSVKRAHVTQSTERAFNQSAIDAVLRSKWQPGEMNGKAVRSRVKLPVVFNP